jgi:hypothetical protein
MGNSSYRAARPGDLPSVPAPRVADIELPAGRLITPDPEYATGDGSPVLWITDEPASDVGALWSRLAAEFASTGLWPLVLESLSAKDGRPWLDGELDPGLSSNPAEHDAGSVLAEWWGQVVPDEGEEEDAFAPIAPFGREFPGLAPASESTRVANASRAVARDLEGRLGLVAVTCPADALSVVGWLGPTNAFSDMGMLSAVLRSWESRFGAYLVGVGFDTITLGVERPPESVEAAIHVAAEHFAACSDCVYQGPGSIKAYASVLAGQREWGFWWD